MAKLTVRDLDVRGKRVFMRVDYNVPMEEKDGQMVITDTTRIVETLPTLKLLIEKGAKIILAAHLGRPKGKREASMSLRPVGLKLHELLGVPVEFADDCIGEHAEKIASSLKDGHVALLENVRYYNEEEANDPAFAENWPKSPMSTSTTPLARRTGPMPRRREWLASSPSAAANALPAC